MRSTTSWQDARPSTYKQPASGLTSGGTRPRAASCSSARWRWRRQARRLLPASESDSPGRCLRRASSPAPASYCLPSSTSRALPRSLACTGSSGWRTRAPRRRPRRLRRSSPTPSSASREPATSAVSPRLTLPHIACTGPRAERQPPERRQNSWPTTPVRPAMRTSDHTTSATTSRRYSTGPQHQRDRT